MIKHTKYFIYLALFVSTVIAGTFEIVSLGPQKLISGDEIDAHIEIRTYGKLNTQNSNAILIPTAFRQTTKDIERLIAPGKLADSTKFFVILAGAYGNGVSSSPVINKTISNKKFPPITIEDMVKGQYRIVTEKFGLKKLFAIIGGSMGGMQALEWAVKFPDLVENLIVYVSTPKLTSADIFAHEISLKLIKNGWAAGQSDEEIADILSLYATTNSRSPGFWAENIETSQADQSIIDFKKAFSKDFNSQNYYCQLMAGRTHDITRNFDGSLEKAAKNIKARCLIIISEQDHSVNPGPSKELAKYIGAETLILNNNCGHYAPSCEKKLFYGTINDFLNRAKRRTIKDIEQ